MRRPPQLVLAPSSTGLAGFTRLSHTATSPGPGTTPPSHEEPRLRLSALLVLKMSAALATETRVTRLSAASFTARPVRGRRRRVECIIFIVGIGKALDLEQAVMEPRLPVETRARNRQLGGDL